MAKKRAKSYNDILDQVAKINDYMERTGRASYHGDGLGGSETSYKGNTPQAQRVINVGKKYLNNAEKQAIKKEGIPTGKKNIWGTEIIKDRQTGQSIIGGAYWFPEERAANVKLSYSSRANNGG